MQQLTQKLKSGKMLLIEAPTPSLKEGCVLVKNHYSMISAGTEGSTVKAARKGYIGKAKERPEQVRQVIDTLKTQGPVQTYRAVMKKLDAYSPLGYSCVGEVIGVSEDISEFCIGDFVACGGATASHAEIVGVPDNLCVKLPKKVQQVESEAQRESYLKAAAYNTLGAIALQGVRQADLKLGESCAVIGLGLLGQLTCLLLKASGVKVIGIDIDASMVEIAGKHCTDLAFQRDTSGIERQIYEFTEGMGCDAVIITAATSSLDPVNFAGAIARKKGTIVVVGAVPTGFDREPHYYKKELLLKMSCSYGPGRYDSQYEEKGVDYPYAYVRWTEKRNMQAFQELIASRKIDVSYLTTHIFKLEDSPKAYDMIMERSEPLIGILIEYDRNKEIVKERIQIRSSTSDFQPLTSVNIGFIGAGSYAQSYLLPNIPKKDDVVLKGVMTASSSGSRSVADRFGFEFCTGNADDILKNEEINTVFIATRHDSHGKYVIEALKAGKHVFVEKPLCLTKEDLAQIISIYSDFQPPASEPGQLMVGYNRRFAPLTPVIKEKFVTGPMSIIYRVNAGHIPSESWIQDKEIGGGRVIGEVCHFVDYLTCIIGSLPVSVYAATMSDAKNNHDTLTVSMKYEGGSIGNIQYFANGSKTLFKEYIEIYSHGMTAILKDFRELEIHGTGKPFKKKLIAQDKGQKIEVKSFIESILQSKQNIILPEEIFNTSEVTFKILESIRTGQSIKISH